MARKLNNERLANLLINNPSRTAAKVIEAGGSNEDLAAILIANGMMMVAHALKFKVIAKFPYDPMEDPIEYLRNSAIYELRKLCKFTQEQATSEEQLHLS